MQLNREFREWARIKIEPLEGRERSRPFHLLVYPTFTGTSVIVSLPKMSMTFTATV